MDDNILERAHAFRDKLESEIIQKLSDEDAVNYPELHPVWSGDNVLYKAGFRVYYNGVLYKVNKTHHSQPTWTPDQAHSEFSKVLTSEDGTPKPWERPDSTNPYSKGDKVIHKDHIWESLVDGNIWEPGVTGTESLWEITEN